MGFNSAIKELISVFSLQYHLMRRNCFLEDRRNEMRDIKKKRKEGCKDEEEVTLNKRKDTVN
jgi:hypothetical protein